MLKQGFLYQGKRIYYIDNQGKDASFERWRLTLYYEPHLGITIFFPSQTLADEFMNQHTANVYHNYRQFVQDFNQFAINKAKKNQRAQQKTVINEIIHF